MRVKMSKEPPPAPTASAVSPYPTVIKIVGRPGTGNLPSTIAPPDHPPVHLAVAGDVFDGVLFCAVLFPHEISWMRSGTKSIQFMRILPTLLFNMHHWMIKKKRVSQMNSKCSFVQICCLR